MGHISHINIYSSGVKVLQTPNSAPSEALPAHNIFERIAYLYVRDDYYNLIYDFYFPRFKLRECLDLDWKEVAATLRDGEDSQRYRKFPDAVYCRGRLNDRTPKGSTEGHPEQEIIVVESERDTNHFVGVCIVKDDKDDSDFETDFLDCLLRNPYVDIFCNITKPPLTHIPAPAQSEIEDQIANIFSDRLRFSPKNDQWESIGREVFEKTVSTFVSRGIPVEFVLPAFPCKSTSKSKVAGKLPDMGEELAMGNLVSFCQAIKEVYEPGARVWIVSDGHVFSDCVGVDDEQVDDYNRALRSVVSKLPGRECINFLSLRDIFGIDRSNVSKYQDMFREHEPTIDHLKTKISPIDETCRMALAATCRPSVESVRNTFQNLQSNELRLYRGLSKFMLNDLAHHPEFLAVSKSKRKHMAKEIAFEMILRNQAYSNLVALFFPRCVRLSIHAHSNSGPKFAISLMPRDVCHAAMTSLQASAYQDDGLDSHHIPTPWHNCIVELKRASSRNYIVTKAGLVKEALDSRLCSGKWVCDEDGLGGRYVIEEIDAKPVILYPCG